MVRTSRQGLGFLLIGALATLAAGETGCSDDDPPSPGVSLGRNGADQPQNDGGATSPIPQSPRPSGAPVLPSADDEVVLEFGAEAISLRIEVDADPQSLDVHFSVDTTGSIEGEIHDLQRDLQNVVIPELKKRIANVAFGVSAFQDFPLPPFGSEGGSRGIAADRPFRLLTGITTDIDRVGEAVMSLDQPLGSGGDVPEAGAEALWQIATGQGFKHDGIELIKPFTGKAERGGGKLGGVGFRENALRVVLHVTDAPTHEPADYEPVFSGTHSLVEAGDELAALHCRLVGIVSAGCSKTKATDICESSTYRQARGALEQLALRTGAIAPETSKGRCAHGADGEDVPSVDGECPLVFDVASDGTGLSKALLDALTQLVDGIRFDAVNGVASDDPIGFVQRIVPSEVRQRAGDEPAMTDDLLPTDAPDGEPDSFVAVHSKTRLAFEVWLHNLRIAPSDVDQHFRVIVQVLGDGLLVDQRTIRVVVPRGDRLAPRNTFDAAPPTVDQGDTATDADAGA